MTSRPLILLACLALALLALPGFAQDDPPAEQPVEEPAEAPADEEAAELTPEEDASDDFEYPPLIGGSEEELEGPLEEEVRRKRPRSDKEERDYKKQLALKDPYLHFDFLIGPTAQSGEFYNPIDWLADEVPLGVARYMVQDASGSVVGYSTVSVETRSDPAQGSLISVTSLCHYPPEHESKLIISAETLRPRLLLERCRPQGGSAPEAEPDAPEEAAADDALSFQRPSLRVEYLFDRVSVQKTDGIVTKGREFRQLPYSFELQQLPLVARMLDIDEMQWPFEAAVTDPLQARNLPLQIASAKRAETLSAEPKSYQCWELPLRLGDESYTWWVERLPPYRLIKYSLRGYTFTLMGYAER